MTHYEYICELCREVINLRDFARHCREKAKAEPDSIYAHKVHMHIAYEAAREHVRILRHEMLKARALWELLRYRKS